MKKLTKEMLDQRDELVSALTQAIDAIQLKGGEIDDLVVEYNGEIVALNEALSAAREFVGNVSEAMQEFMDDKSEKWAESEAGSAYSDWLDEWTNVDLTDVEELVVNTDSTKFDGSAETLESLPTEPG